MRIHLWGLVACALVQHAFAQSKIPIDIERIPGLQRFKGPRKVQVRVAVVVGINKYSGKRFTPLKFAVNDAQEVGRALSDLGYDTKGTLFLDDDATSSKLAKFLRNELPRRFENADPATSQLVFFFAGHGMTSVHAYPEARRPAARSLLAVSEADGGESVVEFEQVVEMLRSSRFGHRIFWIDACRDNDGAAKLPVGETQFSYTIGETPEAESFLFAAEAGKSSYESPKVGHGFFSKYLIQGLRGQASSQDGLLRLGDLETYVQKGVLDDYSVQRPYYTGRFSGELVLGRPIQEPSVHLFDNREHGTFCILLPVMKDGKTEDECVDASKEKANEIISMALKFPQVRDGLNYVFIPNGKMSHFRGFEVNVVTPSFRIGQTEVSVNAFRRFAKSEGYAMPAFPSYNPGWKEGQMPMVNVTWQEADRYCRWNGGRLPTEMEWVWALNSGLADSDAWTSAEGNFAHVIGQRGTSTATHVYDMLGNAWEWTNTWLVEDDDSGAKTAELVRRDELGPRGGTHKIMKGGSFERTRDLANGDVVAFGSADQFRSPAVGFRCIIDQQDVSRR